MVNANDELEITLNGHGDSVYSLHQEIDYFASEGHERNDDHWVFQVATE
jgi:hypothetical protein